MFFRTKTLIRAGLIPLAIGFSSCTSSPIPPSELGPGLSKDEVLESLGEPDQIQDFVLPEGPFFGPQEGLINLLPAGTVVEEWVYGIGDEVTFVWFSGTNGDVREDWRVIDVGTFPKGAVF